MCLSWLRLSKFKLCRRFECEKCSGAVCRFCYVRCKAIDPCSTKIGLWKASIILAIMLHFFLIVLSHCLTIIFVFVMSKIMLRLHSFLPYCLKLILQWQRLLFKKKHNYKWSQTKRIDRQCSVKLLNIFSSAAGLLNAEHVYDSY